MSTEFIAPGNIYRLLAVLHPGIIGYAAWFGYALRALIVAYMQIWIPYQIATNTLKRWQCLGVKSPLWFLANCGTFFAMVTALGTLCTMFAQKCVRHIFHGAEANMYILSHDSPSEGGSGMPASRRSSVSSQASEPQPEESLLNPLASSLRVAGLGGLSEGAEQALGSLKGGVNTAFDTYKRLEHPELSDKSASFNEYFWCTLSMLLNVLMSILLEAAMFLKVATFTGRIANVAMTAVSLYFIFDLDDRIMEADPKLRQRYRRAVAAQTVPIAPDKRPRAIPILANVFASIVKLTVPLALIGVVLFAWRRYDDGFIIGGDGLSVV